MPVHKSDVIQELQDIGLTSYEARCYVSLASLGPSDPAKVAADSNVPKPSAYTALKGLAAKGWADVVTKKPATYRAKKPGDIREVVIAKADEAFRALDRVYRTEPAQETELVYTLRGSERVMAKVYEMLRRARRSIILVAPSMSLEDGKMLELLGEGIERGVSVRVIGDEGASGVLPPGAEIRTGSLVAMDLLVDDEVALIALPDYSACGWIDSPAVASHFKQFLELLWATSTPT